MPARQRPGGRSARVREAVLQAALDEIADVGYDKLQMERVAARAGVNKTTLYRWWPRKGALLADAVLLGLPPQGVVEPPDLGSVRDDILGLWRLGLPAYGTPRALAIGRALEAAGGDPDVAAARRALWERRVDAIHLILRRGVRRGQVRRGLDAELVTDLLMGPVIQRSMREDGPLEMATIRKVTDAVLAGLRPRRK